MKKKSLSVSLLLCAGLCAQASAQAHSLQSLIESALRYNPGRLEAREALTAAENDARSERAARLFSGSVGASAKRSGTIASESGNSGFPKDESSTSADSSVEASTYGPAGSRISAGASYSASIPDASGARTLDTISAQGSVRLPVFVNGKPVDGRLEKAAVRSAVELPLEAAREAAAASDRSLADSVIRLALDAASAERLRSLAVRKAALAGREAEIAAVRRENGLIGFDELYRAEREADEARAAAQEALFSLDAKKRTLAKTVGIPAEELDLTALAAPDPVSGDALERLVPLASSASVRNAAKDRERAEYARILAGAQDAPSLSLSAQVSVPGPSARSESPIPSTSWSAGIGMTVPLTAGAAGARRAASDSRIEAARLAEKNALADEEAKRQALLDAYESALAREKLRSQFLERVRSRQKEVALAAASGTATAVDIERASVAVEEARLSLEDARSARFFAALDACALGLNDPAVLCGDIAVQDTESEE